MCSLVGVPSMVGGLGPGPPEPSPKSGPATHLTSDFRELLQPAGFLAGFRVTSI